MARPDVADLTPPTSPDDLPAWLLRQEERIAAEYSAAIRSLVEKSARRYVRTLVAAGDPAALDGVTTGMRRIADATAAELADLRLSGSLSAWIRLGTGNIPPLAIQRAWADVVNQSAIEYLAAAQNRIRNTTETAWLAVKDRVTSSLQSGTANRTLQNEIQRITGYATSRAEAIARTEVMQAYNGGIAQGASALPADFQPLFKEWLATGDARTRPTHAEANGQVVPYSDPFMVGGSQMPYPGDGPAEEVIQCRCTMLLYYEGDTLPDGSTAERKPIV